MLDEHPHNFDDIRGATMSDKQYDPDAVARSITQRIWTDHDVNAIPEVFASDVVFTDVAFEMTYNGHEGVRAYFHRCLEHIPDFRVDLITVIDVGPGMIATHWTYAGTYQLPTGPKPFRLPGVSLIAVSAEGKVVKNSDYYGAQAFLSALGHAYASVEALRNRKVG
jgi:steroid delta-isomerase-like uncharacterized protein